MPPRPPRRAKAKPRLTRMDAACDHLERMGFSREDVRRTVNRLLKVYGEDAWVFLEEDGYRVVIDAMIEEQETGAESPPTLDHHPHEEPAEPLQPCESVNETCVGETSISHECLVGEDAKKLMVLDISENSEFHSRTSECVEQGDAPEQGQNDGERYKLLTDIYSTRRRPPCYGWISEDEDEIVDELSPTTYQKQAMVQCSLSLGHVRKRKSRWDVKPGDS